MPLWRAGTWTSALPCASRMSMRSVCHISVFRFCMICSTNGRIPGVSVSIPHGPIWMPWCARNTFRCLPWSPRIRSRILTFLESRSSMRCVIPTFYRFWIFPVSRWWQLTVPGTIRSWSAEVHVLTIQSLWQISLIFSISEKAKSFTMNCWNFSKKQKRKAGAVKSFSIRHPILPVFMFRLFIKYLITRTVPLQPLNRFMMMYRKPSKNRSLWMWQMLLIRKHRLFRLSNVHRTVSYWRFSVAASAAAVSARQVWSTVRPESVTLKCSKNMPMPC